MADEDWLDRWLLYVLAPYGEDAELRRWMNAEPDEEQT